MVESFENGRMKAWKALTIGFIIGIVIVNLILIIKICFKKKFMLEPKKLTIISLAIADIFNAMFTLVVDAIQVFDDWSYDKLSCTTEWVSNMYDSHLINFVYGMGLVVLGLELTLRLLNKSLHQRVTGNLRVLLSIVVGGVPWFLGIVIIVPLYKEFTYRGSSFCYTFDSFKKQKIMHGVSSCLPASAALLTGILIMFVRQKRPESFSSPLSSSETQAENSIMMNTQDPSTIQMQNLATNQSFSGNSHPSDHQAPNSTPSSPNPYVISPPENPPQTTNQSQPEGRAQPTASIQPVLTNYTQEKLTLLFVCIVNFICVIPFNPYRMNWEELSESLEWSMYLVINDILVWLMISRSVLTPLIWIFLWSD